MNEEKIPDVLYKYYPPTSWKYVFRDWTIRFTPSDEFNDPFEGAVSLREYYKDKTTVALCKIAMICLGMPVRILCLTESCKNILMWSYYAKGHQGFVVGYSTAELKNIYPDLDIFKVNYWQKMPTAEEMEHCNFSLFYGKSSIWSHEKEWRCLLYESKLKNVNKFGASKISKSAVKEIIFGSNMEIDKCKKHFLETDASLSHIKFCRAFISYEDYEMKISNYTVS